MFKKKTHKKQKNRKQCPYLPKSAPSNSPCPLGNLGFFLHHAHQNKLRCGLAFIICQEGERRGPECRLAQSHPGHSGPAHFLQREGQGSGRPGALSTRRPPQGPLCSPSSPSAQGLCWPLVLRAIPYLLEPPDFPVLAPPSGLSTVDLAPDHHNKANVEIK